MRRDGKAKKIVRKVWKVKTGPVGEEMGKRRGLMSRDGRGKREGGKKLELPTTCPDTKFLRFRLPAWLACCLMCPDSPVPPVALSALLPSSPSFTPSTSSSLSFYSSYLFYLT